MFFRIFVKTHSDATAILIPETAHCANMYPERDEDPPQLKQARITVSWRITIKASV